VDEVHQLPSDRRAGQSREGRKPFFFEKKNQKTSISLGSLYPERPQPKESRVFCFFFSKKKRLLLRCCLYPIALDRRGCLVDFVPYALK
jgi:hypothetical protein